jgi:hypothetical protein
VLPSVVTLSSFEVFRDGGSLSASFLDDAGVLHELIFPIHIVSRAPKEPERIGYLSPKLSTYHRATHYLPTTGEPFASWESNSVAVTWEEARFILATLEPQAAGVSNASNVFPTMWQIANSEGSLSSSA